MGMNPNADIFEMSVEDLDFILDYLPPRDLFTQQLRERRDRLAERVESRRAHDAEWEDRFAPLWNRMIWRVVTGEAR